MEIESKILISESCFEEFVALKNEERMTPMEHLESEDSYYSAYPSREEAIAHGEPLVRLRKTRGGNTGNTSCKCILTMKKKSIKDGVEYNEESESYISEGHAEETIQVAFPNKWFTKSKEAYGFHCCDGHAHVEFVKVSSNNTTIHAVEIECTDVDDIDLAKEYIRIAFLALGFKNPETQYNLTSWKDLLGGGA